MPKKKTARSKVPWLSRARTRDQRILLVVFVLAFAAIGTALVTKTLAASACVDSVWAQGSRGTCVEIIQNELTYLHQQYPHGIPYSMCLTSNKNQPLTNCNGMYGSQTFEDVAGFQATNFPGVPHGGVIPPSQGGIDGRVGHYTWRKLCWVAEAYQVPMHGAGCTVFVTP